MSADPFQDGYDSGYVDGENAMRAHLFASGEIELPRCATCRHWRHTSPDSSWGYCEAVTEVSDSAWLDTEDDRLHLCTARDHGCTAHEEGVNVVAAFVAGRPPTEETEP